MYSIAIKLRHLVMFVVGMLAIGLQAQVHLQLELTGLPTLSPSQRVGVRGGQSPLSWEKTTPMVSQAGGSYRLAISLVAEGNSPVVAYKYVIEEGDSVLYELAGRPNRLAIKGIDTVWQNRWNHYAPIPTALLPTLSPQDLMKDLPFLEAAIGIHPGLFRYLDSTELAGALSELAEDFSQEITYSDAYLALSRFLAKLKCGHTYANFFNQPELIKAILHWQANKLPFSTRIADGRVAIYQDLTENSQFPSPVELLAIDGRPMTEILDTLLTYVKGDGNRMAKRTDDLQIMAAGSYEAFDVFYPLLFPPKHGQVALLIQDEQGKKQTLSVPLITLKERTDRMRTRFPDGPKRYDESWEFKQIDQEVGYLKMGDFATYKMSMDWRAFLENAFESLDKEEVPNLIVDIRGNEGGMDEVLLELARYLVKTPFSFQPFETRTRYEVLPKLIQPITGSWDMSPADLRGQTTPIGQGMYRLGEPSIPQVIPAGDRVYQGKIYLMIDAANSSATFYMAEYARQGKFATLVGQETGGNRRGVNGGHMWFVSLPHSQIEIDIPAYGTFPPTPQPDRGIVPDWEIPVTFADVLTGTDHQLEVLLRRIHATPTSNK